MDKQDTILHISANLWNEFVSIPDNEKHPDDTNDFRFHLHALQNIMYAQKYKKIEKPITFEITAESLMTVITKNTCFDK